ncbi:IS200/IS605 family accessory protein TnpB-related protein [Methanosphaera sp. BMS]|uniref:zinc ribbon domain-containing protein n=1 Tax=Methanosphaera sp. BMS TaxID=1789762 RepID=UPI0013A6B55F|nr:IS200/IS605 family accessory protein TnpB-related protein [Methanosphaera sp. BMS]MDO5825616.1 transposase [Methanosphaera sp.]
MVYKKTNKIQDFIDKISHMIVLKYQNICMETLNIKSMMKNNKFSSKLQRISISKFVDTLKYKSSWNNRNFIQVDRFYLSNKLCRICGYKFDLTLDMRKWTCPIVKPHMTATSTQRLTY